MPGKKEKIIAPEKFSEGERRVRFDKETEPVPEKKEISKQEKIISDELKREIELMATDEGLKVEAVKKAKTISALDEEKKLKHLLEIAQKKGVVFAVQVAKKMNDAYILDLLHDILAKEGYYKKFMK